jgi:hypothetical protein
LQAFPVHRLTLQEACVTFGWQTHHSPITVEKDDDMEQLKGLRALGFALITFSSSLVLSAQAGDPEAIQLKLNAMFTPTKTTADRTDIVTSGSIVVLHKQGMLMYAVASPMPPLSTYKNGRITQGMGGFGRDLAITFKTPDGGTAASYPQRRFVLDEKCWMTGISVERDSIVIQLYSDPYDDTRYYGSLKIPFPNKKVVPSVDEAIQMVTEVVSAAPTEDQAAKQSAPQKSPQPGAPDNSQQTAPPAPTQPIAPPPPPADAPPPTIEIGQKKDEVTAAFGQPARIAKLGLKEIYYYKDMKVTFTSGKVSNVQ